MTKTVKNILGLILSLAALSLGYAAIRYVSYYSQSIQPASFRSFSVTGEAKITALPDIAKFNFQVTNEGGKNLASLQSSNTTATNKVLNYLKSQGIQDKDIKTLSYNVSPRYQTSDCRITSSSTNLTSSVVTSQTCPPPVIVGYTITQTVNVKIRDFTKIGNIMSGIVQKGANQVSSLTFTIDDPTTVKNEARAEAIKKAEAQAQSVAKAAGFKIGRLLSVRDNSPYPIHNNSLMYGVSEITTKTAVVPSIQPGSQEINSSVTMQYEIR